MPVLVAGLLTCLALEVTKSFGYGQTLPDTVRSVLEEFAADEDAKRTSKDRAALVIQAVVAIFLVVGLAQHIAAVGLIGLAVIVLLTAFNGIIEEHQIGHAFEEALPFTHC
jgi:NhaB family Na+:H+ antiporter